MLLQTKKPVKQIEIGFVREYMMKWIASLALQKQTNQQQKC